MSEDLGPMVVQGEEHSFLGRNSFQERDTSERTARLIDAEIQRMLWQAEQRAQQILALHRGQLEALAQALLVHETLDAEMVDRLLKGASAAEETLPTRAESDLS